MTRLEGRSRECVAQIYALFPFINQLKLRMWHGTWQREDQLGGRSLADIRRRGFKETNEQKTRQNGKKKRTQYQIGRYSREKAACHVENCT